MIEQIKRVDAIALVIDAARPVMAGHCDQCDHTCGETRLVIHTYAGGMGADWNLSEAVRAISGSKRREWTRSLVRHDLRVVTAEDHVIHFDVQDPARSRGGR